MLVKELRQGIQSGAFAWTFVGLQVAMFLIMSFMVTLTTGGTSVEARGLDGMVWTAVGLAMVALVPLRGLGAIASERSGSNLDLVRLTHLSATRIVVGKWLALVSQSILLAMATLPYLVIRYFLGGIEVLRDLEVFGWLMAAAMFVAAAAVALSTLPLWLRIGVCVVVTGFILPAAFEFLDNVLPRRRPMGATLWFPERTGIAALVGLYVVACLEFAAGRIAPAAENHAARRRLLTIGVSAVVAVLGLFGPQEMCMAALALTLPLVACSWIGSLAERSPHLASVVASFARRGDVGRIAARVLMPGWATGLVFIGVSWALLMAGLIAAVVREPPPTPAFGIAATLGLLLLATVLFPLPLLVYMRRVQMPLLLYALAQLVCFMVFVWSGAAWNVGRPWHQSPTWFMVLPFPLASLLAFLGLRDIDVRPELQPAFLQAAVVVVAIATYSVAGPWLRDMRSLGRALGATRPGRGG